MRLQRRRSRRPKDWNHFWREHVPPLGTKRDLIRRIRNHPHPSRPEEAELRKNVLSLWRSGHMSGNRELDLVVGAMGRARLWSAALAALRRMRDSRHEPDCPRDTRLDYYD